MRSGVRPNYGELHQTLRSERCKHDVGEPMKNLRVQMRVVVFAFLQACINLGVEMVEGDVRTTRDGVLVIMHDPTLDRMTNMIGPLKSYTYQHLKRARLRNGSGGNEAALTEEIIPSLTEMLRAAKGHLFSFSISMKPMSIRYSMLFPLKMRRQMLYFSWMLHRTALY